MTKTQIRIDTWVPCMTVPVERRTVADNPGTSTTDLRPPPLVLRVPLGSLGVQEVVVIDGAAVGADGRRANACAQGALGVGLGLDLVCDSEHG